MNTAPKLDDQSTDAEDDDLIGQYLQLSLGALNQAQIVDNDKSSGTVTLRGDWSNLITTSDYVKIYCRESRVGNKALYAGQHGYRWDGGFVTVDSVRYRLPNLYWVHHRSYNTDWGRWNQRDPIGIFTDAPNLGNGYTYVGNGPVNGLDPSGLVGDTLTVPSPEGEWEFLKGIIRFADNVVKSILTAGAHVVRNHELKVKAFNGWAADWELKELQGYNQAVDDFVKKAEDSLVSAAESLRNPSSWGKSLDAYFHPVEQRLKEVGHHLYEGDAEALGEDAAQATVVVVGAAQTAKLLSSIARFEATPGLLDRPLRLTDDVECGASALSRSAVDAAESTADALYAARTRVARLKPAQSSQFDLTATVRHKDGSVTYRLNPMPGKKLGKKVTYDAEGFPDFSKHIYRGNKGLAEVEIEYTGNYKADFAAADAKAGFGPGNPRPSDYVWHHHQDIGKMQLVRKDVHNRTPHTGGTAIWREAGFGGYEK